MNSPFSSLLTHLQGRIKSQVPDIRWIDGDTGQLEGYERRPPVSFPCILIDFDGFDYQDLGDGIQQAQGSVIIRLGFDAYSATNNRTPSQSKSKALAYYDLEWSLFKALHGWKPEGYGYMMRVSADTERREDAIRVRQIRFSITFEDYMARPPREWGQLPGDLEVTPE